MKYIYLLLVLFILTACDMQFNVDYKIPYNGDKLAVQGFLSPQGIQVYLQKTSNIYSSQSQSCVNNAQITVLQNGNEWSQLMQSLDFIYRLPATSHIDANKEYTLVINVPDFGVFTTKSQKIPQRPVIDSLKRLPNSMIACYFADPVLAENFYALNINAIYYGKPYFNLSEFEVSPYTAVSDKVFNGQAYFVQKQILRDLWDYNSTPIHRIEADTIQVILQSINKDLYEFCQSYVSNNLSTDNSNLDNIVPIENTVKDAIGFFGAYSADTLNVQIDSLGNLHVYKK
jgi:hypothetical protein